MNKPVDLQAAALTGADAAVEMLRGHGVEVVFGLCGDTSLPLYDALARSRSIRHILTRDERHAAYMADGYARVTGKVGVCEGPSGGGATYILPGLVEANESSVPVLAINTDVAVSSRNRFTLTELDQRALMKPLTKWNAVLDRAADIPRTFRAAFEAMTTGRPGAAHIALPYDVQNAPVERDAVWADPTLGAFPSRRVAPEPFSIELAAKLLRGAKRPLFICGGGVVLSNGESELMALAEKLAAPVATTVSGKGSIDERCAHSVGVVGSNGGTPETRAVVDAADVVVFVGCRAGSVTTERWRHPAPGRARIIHVDVDPMVPGTNYKVDVPIVADAKLALSALAEAVTPRTGDLSWVDEKKREKFEAFETLARSDNVPIKPERVVAELARVLDKDAILVADPGTPCPYFSAYYVVKGSGRRFFSNRAHGALGYSLAAALGAHIGRPAVKTVAVMGDGSFGMCVGELETAVRLRLPITFVV
ncbi:MAG TPA: thiamine pyrophosphate-binding protein, partial [Burkholderiales bacterium]|nr:thiamine pyrophosphate-binding protein [Burkholderiales bacterium]